MFTKISNGKVRKRQGERYTEWYKSKSWRETKTGLERLVHGYIVGIKSFDISKLWSFLKMYHWYMIIVYMF